MAKNFKIDLAPVEYDGITYNFGLGGLHSVDKPGIFRSENGMLLIDADGISYYPTSVINYQVCPEHLSKEIFTPLVEEETEARKQYKKKKKESRLYATLELGCKIEINALFGLFGYEHFFLFDLLCTYQVTINNQLWLLKLIEILSEYGYAALSANTDGVVFYIPQYELHIFRFAYRQWEQLSGFTLEETFYDLYVRRDVNNYVCRKTSGEVKIKGTFIPSGAEIKPFYNYDLPKSDNGDYLPINGVLKGFNKPIVAIALQRYYLDNIDPADTIYGHTDIYDFCASQKVGSQFTNILEYVKRQITTHRPSKTVKKTIQPRLIIKAIHEKREFVTFSKTGIQKVKVESVEVSPRFDIPARQEIIEVGGAAYAHPRLEDEVLEENKVQKTVRFYISKPVEVDEDGTQYGYSLKKEKLNDDGTKQRIDYASGCFVTLFNKFEEKKCFDEYNVDYEYYIDLVNREINKIGRLEATGNGQQATANTV